MQNRQLSRTTKGIFRLAIISALCCSCVLAFAKDPAENTSAQNPFSNYGLNARFVASGHSTDPKEELCRELKHF